MSDTSRISVRRLQYWWNKYGKKDINPTLDEKVTANVTVGGITSGKSYNKGTSLITIIKDLLHKYYAPIANCTGGSTFEVNSTADVIINYSGIRNASSTDFITKIELYKDGVLVDSVIGQAASLNGSYTDEGLNSAHTYTCKVYDSVNGDTVVAQSTTSVNFSNLYFCGGRTQSEGLPTNSAEVRALNRYSSWCNHGATIVGNTTTQIAGKYYLVVCVPDGFTISIQNSLGGPITPIDGGIVEVKTGGGGISKPEQTYRIWYLNGTPEFKNLKIN